MSNSYTIGNTDGSKIITILAGSTNGNIVGASNTDTDLLLYGRGSFNWGAGIEQNLIRLTENWASPAANPSASINSQYPESYSPTPNMGITKPMIGQIWFNKSNNRTYVNVDGQNISGSWKIDAQDRYLSKTEGGSVAADIRVSADSPDIYVHSTRANFGANSHLVFEGNDALGVRTRTGLIYSDNANLAMRIRNYSRDDQNTVLSEIVLRDDWIALSNPTIMAMTSAEVAAELNGRVITTRDYVEDSISSAVSAAPYLPLAGGTMTGNLFITRSAGSLSPQLHIVMPTPTITNPSGVEGGIYMSDHQRIKMAVKMLQGAFNTAAIPFASSLTDSQDTFAIEKYDGGGTNINALYILDNHIETHATHGKIRTPATNMTSDDDRTLVTLKSARDYFQRIGNDLLVDQNNEATLTMRSPVGNLIKMDAETGATLDSRIDFHTEGGLRAKISMQENYPAIGLDTLVLQKWVGSNLLNSLEVHDDSTLSQQKIEIRRPGVNGKLEIFAADNVTKESSYDNGTDIDQRTGIVFRNELGDVRGTILSDNSSLGGLTITATSTNSSKPYISLRYSSIVSNAKISMTGNGIQDTDVPMPFNNELVEKKTLGRRTFKQTGLQTTSIYSLGRDTNDNPNWYNGDTDVGGTNQALAEFPPLEMDYEDKTKECWTEVYASSTSTPFTYRILLHITIPYMLIANGSGTNTFTNSDISLQYRTKNVGSSNFGGWRTITIGTIWYNRSISQYGTFSTTTRIPCNEKQRVQIRMPEAFGPYGDGSVNAAAFSQVTVGPIRCITQLL